MRPDFPANGFGYCRKYLAVILRGFCRHCEACEAGRGNLLLCTIKGLTLLDVLSYYFFYFNLNPPGADFLFHDFQVAFLQKQTLLPVLRSNRL